MEWEVMRKRFGRAYDFLEIPEGYEQRTGFGGAPAHTRLGGHRGV